MLENITEIPSSPPLALLLLIAAGAVSILMIASSLIPVLLATFRTSSRTRNYGIAVAFFVLALSASVSFGADPETVPAVWPYTNQYPTCSNSAAFSCPATCSGGNAQFSFQTKSVVGNVSPPERGQRYYGWSDGGVTTNCYVYPEKPYCPPGYQPDGPDTCRKQSPCASKGGQAVDDGSLDFGDGSNQKLSMSFTRREDDNYVGQTFCSGGCLAAVDKEVGSSGGYFDGKYVGQFSAKFSGQSCPGGASQVSPKTTPALIPKTTPESGTADIRVKIGLSG